LQYLDVISENHLHTMLTNQAVVIYSGLLFLFANNLSELLTSFEKTY